MGVPGFPRRTVEDAAADLIEAAGRLAHARAETARIATALENRWAANRARAIVERKVPAVRKLPLAERSPE
jgi:hypothetical protein